MFMLRGLFFSLSFAISSIVAAQSNSSNLTNLTSLPSSVEKQLAQAKLPSSSISVTVLPLQQQNAKASLSVQAQRLVAPASTMKLVTSAIALDELGPHFRWKTQILSSATPTDGILSSALYLKGFSDPNLTWEKFAIMLRSLRQQQIRVIEGDLILDRSYFNPARPELQTTQFDDNPDAYYNVVPDALMVHSNLSALEYKSDGKKIAVQMLTPLANIKINANLRVNDRPCSELKNGLQNPKIFIQEKGNIEIYLNGTYPKNCQSIHYQNFIERNTYIAAMFKAFWSELGGTWKGKVRDGTAPPEAKVLVERASDTLADTLRIVNKFSDNGMARISFLTLGAQANLASTTSSTQNAAQEVARLWFAKKNINSEGLVIENGSGLSRLDRISTQQLAGVLQAVYQGNWWPEFASSLPIVGIDGTMQKRLKNTSAEARARIKTGYLKDVVAIAGYVRDIHQVEYIVVAIINHDDAAKGKAALDELINWVAQGQLAN
jgi:D-alanyl-D-alanine carboxypeptidase/D-alanyl-D-alanine-endopeptidase (penicillin-binding protein 4)